MDTLQCVVERITYQNPQNGYVVLKCSSGKSSDRVPVIGYAPPVHVGAAFNLQGNWVINKKYGKQFIAKQWEEVLPTSKEGIVKYLSSSFIKGIGTVYAKKIVERFGEDTLDVIENTPDKLLEIDGIGEVKLEQIKKSWEDQREVKNIMMFLETIDVTPNLAEKIFATYKEKSISIVKDNPYRLAEDIHGVGFKTSDAIASSLGIEKTCFKRLQSGILYTLNKLSDDGHCYAVRGQLIEAAVQLLEVDSPELEATLDEMLRTSDVIMDGKAIYLKRFYFSELGSAKHLVRLMTGRRNTYINPDKVIRDVEQDTSIHYDDIQIQAIRQAVESKVMVLTGGPGTGKTTTMNGIISAYKKAGSRILLAAPTGRASKRMSEATGMESKTIHRLLEYTVRKDDKNGKTKTKSQPLCTFQRNEKNPLEGEVLIVDECSMIDILLMHNLLKAIPDDMTLILVGDVDQLPSVGAGNVLRDIIESDCVPVVKLTRIFRQAQGSRIITNAHRINHGHMPDLSNGQNSDFFFAAKEDNEQIVSTLVRYCTQNLPSYYHADAVSDIQVLTPMQKGICGALNLNQVLQNALNPEKLLLKYGATEYRLHDKVMQIKNNYDKDVFNGDIGLISKVNIEENKLTVHFDEKEVDYEACELEQLVLAYATTIHKSQGSEYPIVVIPVTMSHFIMLQRNLLYTGVTRAKKILVLIGQKKAIGMAAHNETTTSRNTMLAERIASEWRTQTGREKGAAESNRNY